jgi:hypothetical protein
MSAVTLVIIILVIVCIAGMPTWGYHSYGYAPTGVIGVVLVVLLILFLLGRL